MCILKPRHTSICLTFFLFLFTQSVMAQTTAFTYQGKLLDNSNPANGNYDFEFKLFDTAGVGTGTQQGSTVMLTNVAVTNGTLTVQLDFGDCPNCFNGGARFLDINVRLAGGGAFTQLSPRQPIASTPYAIKSLSATTADGLTLTCVNCITSSQIASVSGSAVTGTIPVASVPAGSANYIQNTTMQQAASNFNISGDGTLAGTLSANLVNTTTQFNINGLRVLTVNGPSNFNGISFTASNTFVGDSAGVNTIPNPSLPSLPGKYNSFLGAGAGQLNTTGFLNAFFGYQAGYANSTANANAFFGAFAGRDNTEGIGNSFFGYQAGQANTASNNSFFGTVAGRDNTTGSNNAFFGTAAGQLNTLGNRNSFFGFQAGAMNSTGDDNAFFGFQAGALNTTGTQNAYFGFGAGKANTVGSQNAFFGDVAGFANTTGSSNAFFGYSAGLSNTTGISNAFFGLGAGRDNKTGNNNAFFGYGAGSFNTTGSSNTFFGNLAGNSNTTGFSNTFIGSGADFNTFNPTGDKNTLLGFGTIVNSGISNSAAVGANATATQSNSLVLGGITGVNGGTSVNVGIGTTAPLDRLHVNGIIRVDVLGSGGGNPLCLNASNQLSICSALSLNKVTMQTFTGDLVNAIKEQQAQVEAQQKEIAALKKLVCLDHPEAEMCKP